MKSWIVATYKINQIDRLQENLKNQNFIYYNPQIKTSNDGLFFKEEPLFPGYIFIYSQLQNYQKIKYTKGISKVLQFDNHIAVISDAEIIELKKIEKESFLKPIIQKISIGQEATISLGPFEGSLVTIASLPKNYRVSVFVNILGAKRKIHASINKLRF